MKWLWVAAIAACAPNHPFTPRPAAPGVAECTNRPPIPADTPLDQLPLADNDLDGDGHPDWLVRTGCDAQGSCDLAIYLGNASCARHVMTVRGGNAFSDGYRRFVVVEHAVIHDVEATRRRFFRLDESSGIWRPAGEYTCKRTATDLDENGECARLDGAESTSLDRWTP